MGRPGNDANVLKRRRIWRTRARRQVTRLAVTFTGAGEQLLDSLRSPGIERHHPLQCRACGSARMEAALPL